MDINKIFYSNRHDRIRGTILDGDMWFSGEDVVTCLGYCHVPDEVVRNLVKSKYGRTIPKDKLVCNFDGMIQEKQWGAIPDLGMYFINEYGLYSLLFSSDSPDADEIQDWFIDEIIPAMKAECYLENLKASEFIDLILDKHFKPVYTKEKKTACKKEYNFYSVC